jgi:NAD(P)-dependent dehydrogenase (short-subunit alcohol dehydrogenase family)
MTANRKVAFVTGGSSGIGKATARALVEKGYATIIADRNERLGREVEASLKQSGECLFVPCEVTDDAAVKRAVDAASAFRQTCSPRSIAPIVSSLFIAAARRDFPINLLSGRSTMTFGA